MAFYCQRNSYASELTTNVLDCVPTESPKFPGCFDVILEESPFFPEGGGQPADTGYINDAEVKWVFRQGSKMVHHTVKPLDINTQVKCKIDWERRFDYMQHHTGQHLLSAILENDYGIETVSWELGSALVNVELNNMKKLTPSVISEVEAKANRLIRDGLKVDVKLLLKKEISTEDFERMTRGLPDDVPDPIRIVEIDGVDRNMCCGTHLKTLSEIQIMKLLHTETMRDNVRLYFICGNRVLKKLDQVINCEKQLTKLLSSAPTDYPARVEALCKRERLLDKAGQNYMKRIAVLEASELKGQFEKSKFCFVHREEYDSIYLKTFLKELEAFAPADSSTLVVCGPEKGPGVFCVKANDNFFKLKEARILEALCAKGKARNGVLQGKSESLKGMKALVKELEEFSL